MVSVLRLCWMILKFNENKSKKFNATIDLIVIMKNGLSEMADYFSTKRRRES